MLNLRRSVHNPSSTTTSHYCLAIGSYSTRLLYQDKLIFNQPTELVQHHQTGKVIAFGQSARGLMGKTNQQFELVRPIQHGQIADQEVLEQLLSEVFQNIRINQSLVSRLRGKKLAYIQPAQASEVQRGLLADSIARVWSGKVEVVSYDQALLSTGLNHGSHCLIDLGHETTTISLLFSGQVVVQRQYWWGGSELTSAVKDAIEDLHHCSLSYEAAETIKHRVAKCPQQKSQSKKVVIKAKDAKSHTGSTVVVTSTEVELVVEEWVTQLLEIIRDFFTGLEAGLSSDLVEGGVSLVGGGSQLGGLESVLALELKCPVMVDPNPELMVLEGVRRVSNPDEKSS